MQTENAQKPPMGQTKATFSDGVILFSIFQLDIYSFYFT